MPGRETTGAAARWVRLELSAELTQDAHLGSGAGGGGIDALIARDRDDRPVIWASHIEGLLRDAARRSRGGPALADDVFGRRGGQRQRVVFTSLYATEHRSSRVWRSTARASFDNRAPRDETLRAIEHVPKGTCFRGQVEVPASDVQTIRTLLHEVEAVGHGRSTGAGRVRFSLEESSPAPRTIGSPTEWLTLLLRSRDPLSVTATATPGNLIPCLPFVPGRTLLGALAGWLIEEGDRDTASLLLAGEASVSDALPIPAEPARLSKAEVLPAPLSLQSEKPAGVGGSVPWWALAPRPARRLDAAAERSGPRLKRPEPDLFLFRPDATAPWTAHRPFLRVRLRNGRPDGPQQPDPSLFAVEQLGERTLFLCDLRAPSGKMSRLAAALAPVLEGRRWLRVGRGGAPVEVARLEWSQSHPHADVRSRAYMILTSDLLVRDDLLRWRTALASEDFRNLPGWPDNVSATPVVQDTAAIHGFNGTSRLWRLPAAAVRRGSVIQVEGDGLADLARAAAEGRWLGERTHEGFGRFRIDATLPGVTSAPTETAAQGAGAQASDAPQEAVAARARGWFERHKRLADPGRSSERRPSLSQWQDLVAELERDSANALPSRLRPTTVGGHAWTASKDASDVLLELEKLPVADRSEHARIFVRWLRAEMRRRAR